MPFPETPRIIYDRNPLEEVICQLKFPPILRIDSELPAPFQDAVRREYPLLQEAPGIPVELTPAVSQLLAADLSALVGSKTYHFVSGDNVWRVALNREFVALSTRTYRRWEEFRERLGDAFDALISCYSPAFFVRVGLRYRDLINKAALGLGDTGWSDLLTPQILGELASPEVAPFVQRATREILISLGDPGGSVRVRHGLARRNGAEEMCYLIDSDFFTEGPTEVADAFRILDGFKREATRLFRWCITDKLHELLGPRPIV